MVVTDIVLGLQEYSLGVRFFHTPCSFFSSVIVFVAGMMMKEPPGHDLPLTVYVTVKSPLLVFKITNSVIHEHPARAEIRTTSRIWKDRLGFIEHT